MKIKLNITLLSIFLFIAFSCKDSSVTPKELQPGRRDYVWTVDTIRTFNPLYRMWGSSPDDVWAITVGTFTEDIYHFDGEKWTSGQYILPDPRPPYSIYGFAWNYVLIGAQNKIFQFNGSSWKEVAALSKDGHTYDIVFDNLWGESSNNFYAFGAYPDEEGNANNSIIAHYNKGNWEMLNTDDLFGIVEHLYINSIDKKIYLQVIGGLQYTDSTHIYEYSLGKYTKLYSNLWSQGLQGDISLINNEVYFILGNEISTRRNNKFQTVLKVDTPNFYQRIWGRNSKDIFLMMVDGLAHYNGSNIEYMFHYNLRTQIYGAALFEKDVFFLINESQTNLNLVYHGKLKE